MLLTVSTTHAPATDLGYLLHKHPARLQSVELAVGQAHVFYPECDDRRCTAALYLDVDAVCLMRGRDRRAQQSFALGQYVNDRPYVASSLASVAIGKASARRSTAAVKTSRRSWTRPSRWSSP